MSIESIKARLVAATPGPWRGARVANGRTEHWAIYVEGPDDSHTAIAMNIGREGDGILMRDAPADLALLLNALQAYHSQHDTECKCSACDLYDVLEASL